MTYQIRMRSIIISSVYPTNSDLVGTLGCSYATAGPNPIKIYLFLICLEIQMEFKFYYQNILHYHLLSHPLPSLRSMMNSQFLIRTCKMLVLCHAHSVGSGASPVDTMDRMAAIRPSQFKSPSIAILRSFISLRDIEMRAILFVHQEHHTVHWRHRTVVPIRTNELLNWHVPNIIRMQTGVLPVFFWHLKI